MQNMLSANYSELRSGLKQFLDKVEENNETLIIKRSKGKGTVMISLEEYNSIIETLHLLSSKNNAKRIFESIEQMQTGVIVTNNLIDVE
ncbi:MAG: type II toxin-antitoxin system Phd/YefM family antitoxin [Candidatus Kapabacteria bacterium]|nr:type II toxin-antitoxin system Phd/YefM family antitoxin [Candidatus Kapabacteria bacterium]